MDISNLKQSKEYREFMESLNLGSGRYKKRDVFSDLITTIALGIKNKYDYDSKREEYINSIVEKYNPEERVAFAFLSNKLRKIYSKNNDEYMDILGTIYSEICLMNKEVGQVFTPHSMAKLMATTVDIDEKVIEEQGFLDLEEPSCRFWSFCICNS